MRYFVSIYKELVTTKRWAGDAMYGSVTDFNKETEIMCYSGSSTPVFVDRSTGVEYSELIWWRCLL